MEKLEKIAAALSQDAANASKAKLYLERIAQESDVEELIRLGEKYTPVSHISIPAYERVLQLDGRNLKALVELSTIYWLDGEDESAKWYLEKAAQIDPEAVDVLLLKAGFLKNRKTQLELYKKVLQREPQNEVALSNVARLKSKSLEL
jgi:hypothetical protein